MTDVIEALSILTRLARELDQRSTELAQTSKELEPAQRAFQDWKDKYELGLYREAAKGASTFPGNRVPSADLREKLALESMPKGLYGAYLEPLAKRERLKQRISDIKAEMSAWQTGVNAEKTLSQG